jgi:diguanylate cyclase (GGDEF)-like protein
MIATRPPIREPSGPALQDGMDASTGLPGARFWRLVLTAESARDTRYGRVATIVMVSIVGLERLALACGPDVVEVTVARLAKVLRSGARRSDFVARLGDARFGVLLTETAEIAAINMVERVREQCEAELSGLRPGVHVAFGWASPSGSGTLLRSATRAESRLRRDAARLVVEFDQLPY